MKKMTLVLIASACCMALTMTVSAQQADQAVADAVIAMTKAQWASDIKEASNVAEQFKDAADDYTELNANYSTRIDGKAMSIRLGEGTATGSVKRVAAEMANPKVQVYNGDVAILTYNYVGLTRDKDGKTEAVRAKSTRIFVKKDSKWTMVHANFGADPLAK